jgi:hypothetical protein
MKSWIVTEIDALFGAQGKLRAMVLNGLVLALTAIITWTRLSRFATPDEILTWSTALTGMICTAAVHFIDSHISNANVANFIAAPTATPQQAAQPSQPPTPPAPVAQPPVAVAPAQPPSSGT